MIIIIEAYPMMDIHFLTAVCLALPTLLSSHKTCIIIIITEVYPMMGTPFLTAVCFVFIITIHPYNLHYNDSYN